MSAHTPTPWVKRHFGSGIWLIDDGKMLPTPIAKVFEGEADADRIVRCVNAHDELVTALKGMIINPDAWTNRAREALAKVLR